MSAPTFGNYLRAARLGFHWYAPLARFVRISDLKSGTFLVEAVTPDCLPSNARGEYRCWWEKEQRDEGDILAACPALFAAMKANPSRIRLVVNDDGLEVSQP